MLRAGLSNKFRSAFLCYSRSRAAVSSSSPVHLLRALSPLASVSDRRALVIKAAGIGYFCSSANQQKAGDNKTSKVLLERTDGGNTKTTRAQHQSSSPTTKAPESLCTSWPRPLLPLFLRPDPPSLFSDLLPRNVVYRNVRFHYIHAGSRKPFLNDFLKTFHVHALKKKIETGEST